MDITNKIAIINSLMEEDRAEIRINKIILINASYFVVSGIIAITAFAISNDVKDLESYLIVGCLGIWSFFLLYILTFLYFKHHLNRVRKCLDIRESYYKDFKILENEKPFKPLKSISKNENPSYLDEYLFFLPTVVFLVAISNTVVLICIF